MQHGRDKVNRKSFLTDIEVNFWNAVIAILSGIRSLRVYEQTTYHDLRLVPARAPATRVRSTRKTRLSIQRVSRSEIRRTIITILSWAAFGFVVGFLLGLIRFGGG